MNYSRFQFQFPDATPRAQDDEYVCGDTRKQVERIGLEVCEAIDAVDEGQKREAVMELMDVIHAAETALRLLGVKAAALNDAKQSVVTKNRERGYYL